MTDPTDPLTLQLVRNCAADALDDALRDDLADARRERDLYRLLFRCAMDALSLSATAPERAEQIQRDLRKEREQFMAEQFARERAS